HLLQSDDRRPQPLLDPPFLGGQELGHPVGVSDPAGEVKVPVIPQRVDREGPGAVGAPQVRRLGVGTTPEVTRKGLHGRLRQPGCLHHPTPRRTGPTTIPPPPRLLRAPCRAGRPPDPDPGSGGKSEQGRRPGFSTAGSTTDVPPTGGDPNAVSVAAQ